MFQEVSKVATETQISQHLSFALFTPTILVHILKFHLPTQNDNNSNIATHQGVFPRCCLDSIGRIVQRSIFWSLIGPIDI